MARRQYDDSTKAAVMAALLAGQSVSSVAREYNIPKGTVSGWKRKANEATDGGVVEIATQKQQEEIGDLLLDYIHASLVTLKKQAEHFGDESWLASQDADSLAVLHGVQVDKAVRLLEALAGGAEG